MIEISENLVRHAVGVLNEHRHRNLENWEYAEDSDAVYAIDPEHGVNSLSGFEAVACSLLYVVNLGAMTLKIDEGLAAAIEADQASGIPDMEENR